MGQILNEYDIGIYKGTRNIFSVLSIVGSVSNCSLEFVQKGEKESRSSGTLCSRWAEILFIEFWMVFRVDNNLFFVQTMIPGKHIADGDGN